jgi:hypothetical protein
VPVPTRTECKTDEEEWMRGSTDGMKKAGGFLHRPGTGVSFWF